MRYRHVCGGAFGALLALGAGQAVAALDQNVLGPNAVCQSGDCENGDGVVTNERGDRYTGSFSAGRPRPGMRMQVEVKRRPGEVFFVEYDAMGIAASGVMPRGAKAVYSGTFKAVQHRFVGRSINTMETGRLDDGNGLVLDGRFEYVSVPWSADLRQTTLFAPTEPLAHMVGIYLFSGTRTHQATGAVDTGIFASDLVYPGEEIVFTPADVARISDIRQRYLNLQPAPAAEDETALARQRAMQARVRAEATASAGVAPVTSAAAPSAASSDAGDALLGGLFQVAAGALVASIPNGGASGLQGMNSFNLAQMAGVITGQTSPDAAMAAMANQAMAGAVGQAMGSSVTPEALAALGRSQGSMNAAQFAALAAGQMAAGAQGGGVKAAVPPNVGGSGAHDKKNVSVPPAAGDPSKLAQPAPPAGARVPKLEMLTLPCSNENGNFTGQSKVPVSPQDCRAEVIAHRKVQCRSDWFSDPSFAAMKACFQRNGIADLSRW